MALLKINLSGSKSIFIMSLDIEADIIETLKKNFLMETLQATRMEVAAISDDNIEYQCAKYSLNLDEPSKEIIMEAAKQMFRKGIEKSLPEISKS